MRILVLVGGQQIHAGGEANEEPNIYYPHHPSDRYLCGINQVGSDNLMVPSQFPRTRCYVNPSHRGWVQCCAQVHPSCIDSL